MQMMMDWRRESLLMAGRPDYYIETLGMVPYDWQKSVLDRQSNRVCLIAPRQSGKSIIVAGLACHQAKTSPGTLVIIIAPKLAQATETARKVKDFIAMDDGMMLKRSNDQLAELDTGARILCLAATENAPRGYSAPDLIIIDEASRVPDEVYASLRPQLTTNPWAKLIILSTPFGRSGFFWRAWAEEKVWKKVRVETGFRTERTERGLLVVPDIIDVEARKAEWASKDVDFYISPHHRLEWLQEELDSVGEWWWSQEYGIEFKESVENLFDFDDIRAAFAQEDVLPALYGKEQVDKAAISDMPAFKI